MENDNCKFNLEFYSQLEKGIESLPVEMQEMLYKPCAENCVKKYVLNEMLRQFNECEKNLDVQFQKYGNTPYFFAKIIEAGHIYEIGYPTNKCVCPMVEAKIANSKVHCECSKQSMLCVIKTLLPNKKVKIQLIHSVLTGASNCCFRLEIE